MGREVDQAFVQAVEHRPKGTPVEAGEGIPLIDLSPLLETHIPNDGHDVPQALSNLVSEVEAASRDWGFFQVIHHGVPSELLHRVQSAAKAFFALPAEEKRRVKRDEDNPLGYNDAEHTKNVRDWKEVFDFRVPAGSPPDSGRVENQWPEYPPDLRGACEEYAIKVEKLASNLLGLIALSLRLPTKRLTEFFKDGNTVLRLNYYPPCPTPDLALGVGQHKDSGALTVLYQDDVGGLEVKRKSDGEWVRVKPIPNSYIINIGDILQVLSNDRYESVEHRVVVNTEKERLSIPLFIYPAYSAMVGPLEELVDERSPARYREYKYGDFYAARMRSNYKNLGVENIQIHHFRKTV